MQHHTRLEDLLLAPLGRRRDDGPRTGTAKLYRHRLEELAAEAVPVSRN